MGYMGLVVCEHENNPRRYLFQFPSYESLNEGDMVIVDTKNGEAPAKVLWAVDYIDIESDVARMILGLAGVVDVSRLKRVLRKVYYRDMRYQEDEE